MKERIHKLNTLNIPEYVYTELDALLDIDEMYIADYGDIRASGDKYIRLHSEDLIRNVFIIKSNKDLMITEYIVEEQEEYLNKYNIKFNNKKIEKAEATFDYKNYDITKPFKLLAVISKDNLIYYEIDNIINVKEQISVQELFSKFNIDEKDDILKIIIAKLSFTNYVCNNKKEKHLVK